MIVERAGRRRRGGVAVVVVAWLVVLGGTVALGVAGRAPEVRTAAATPEPVAVMPTAPPSAPSAAKVLRRSPLPTRPPIGEDGIMGGLPFGTAWLWLESD
jgi:hypothetical protein